MATSHHIETLDELGHRVRVGPGDPTAADVLEYAELLIDREGWNQLRQTGNESSVASGWTLHDAIGEACRRLSAPGGGRTGGSKDAVYYDAQGMSVGLRTGAQDAVDAELERMRGAGEWTPTAGDFGGTGPTAGRIDYAYNDEAQVTQDDILGVLRRAREAV